MKVLVRPWEFPATPGYIKILIRQANLRRACPSERIASSGAL